MQPQAGQWAMALIGSLGLALPTEAIAQTTSTDVLPLVEPAETSPAENRPNPDSSPPPMSPTPHPSTHPPIHPSTAPRTVALTLPDLINLTLAGNRDLQNEGLERIVQRQTLNEAEQTFDPRFTPRLEASVTRRLSEDDLEITDPSTGEILFGTSPTSRSSRAVLETTVTTRQGTDIRVEVDPINGDRLLNFRLSQPLLRGFGTAVNEAPVNQARLGETRNQLALQNTVIDLITLATTRYTNLISAQAQVDIQVQALGRRQRQLEILQALVTAGRRAPIDVFDTEPLPPSPHFADCPKLLLTPHIAGVTAEANERVSFMIADELLKVLR